MKIYCSGIGGIGLSAYAALQNANGHEVLGSDRALTDLTEDLESQGITVFDSQDGSKVCEDADIFVYSEAIPESAPERVKASEYGIRQLSYFAALGELSKEYETVIAICGTHGKSTTTAMIANVLVDVSGNYNDTTVIVGTKVPYLNGKNWWRGQGKKRLIVEACEYKGSFFHLKPDIVLMTNVDWDHVDYYPNPESYQRAYIDFLSGLSDDAIVITHMQDKECALVVQKASRLELVVDADNVPLTNFHLKIPGRHMTENATLVYALCTEPVCGIQLNDFIVGGALSSYNGTWRRFEEKGRTKSGAIVVDDYAHHPREIVCTIASAIQKYPNANRIISLFQPHLHNRTIALMDDLSKAFIGSQIVLVTDVYEARTENTNEKVDMNILVDAINTGSTPYTNSEKKCIYVGDLSAAKKFCCNLLQQDDVLIVMGAGTVTNVAQELIA